jgi:hypothetical protein
MQAHKAKHPHKQAHMSDPAVAAHHAKIEQEYQALVADAPDTPVNGTTGPSPERGRRSNQEGKDTKQQATMAALQNSSNGRQHVCRMVTDLFNLVGHQSGPNRMAQGQCYQHLQRRVHGRHTCNSYRPITVLPVIDKLCSSPRSD